MTDETKEVKKNPSKATILVEDDGEDVTLTVTFDPAPTDRKDKPHAAANIASGMVNAFNAKCVMVHGGIAISCIKIPQLGAEYNQDQVHTSAMNELTKIMKELVQDHILNAASNLSEDTKDESDVPAKRTLH